MDTATIARQRSAPAGADRPVPEVPTRSAEWRAFAAHLPGDLAPADEAFVTAASGARSDLPAGVQRSLAAFVADPGARGAVLLRGVPTGDVPFTPPSPLAAVGVERSHLSELALVAVARMLGEPVGYVPEHGGQIVQHLLPTPTGAHRQTSTSSAVELEFHTETAFHPHKPRYLLLLCLRGDPAAVTLLCSIADIIGELPTDVRRVLGESRFRTGVDESFTGGRRVPPGAPVPVLAGDDADRPTLTFDADLMHGTDPEAQAALDALAALARERRLGLVLEPGDLLVVDNHACIHGRSAFAARYDGTDRWLQRTFVVPDLEASRADRVGRVITTVF